MNASLDDTTVLNALFADSPQGLFVFDSDHTVMRYNPSGLGVRDLPAEEVIGHRVHDFAPGFDADATVALIDEVLRTGEPVRRHQIRGRAPSAPYNNQILQVSLFPLDGPAGEPRRVVGVVEDVTEHQAAADRLAVLSGVHAALGPVLEARPLADGLVGALVPAFADAASVDLLDEAGGRARGSPTSRRGTPLCAVCPSHRRTPSRAGRTARVARSRSPPRTRRPWGTRGRVWSPSRATPRG